jgi:hypothetical protein
VWDVRHLGRDQRPTLIRQGLQWDVKHVAARGREALEVRGCDSPELPNVDGQLVGQNNVLRN